MFLFLGVKTPKGAQEKNWKYLVRLDLVPGLDSVMYILKDNLKTHSFNLTQNKLRKFSSSWPGSRVRQCYVYFEGQFENTFFQPDAEQTKEPAKKKIFEEKISSTY